MRSSSSTPPAYLSNGSTWARVYAVLRDLRRGESMPTLAVALRAGVDVQDAARALEWLELRGHVFRVDEQWRHVGRIE